MRRRFHRPQLGAVWAACAAIIVASVSPHDANAADKSACFGSLIAAIDIGHTRVNPGAKDVFGRAELDYNYELVARIEGQLARSGIGSVIVINRSLDVASLPERPQIAYCSGADVFVSIHHDNVDGKLKDELANEGQTIRFNDRIEGYTVYFSSRNARAELSRDLGLSIAEGLLAQGVLPATPFQATISDELRRPVSAELNVFDFPKLKVSLTSPIPAVLVEAGFISSRSDMRRLRSFEYQSRIAQGIVQGLKAMCTRHPGLAGLAGAQKDRQCNLNARRTKLRSKAA